MLNDSDTDAIVHTDLTRLDWHTALHSSSPFAHLAETDYVPTSLDALSMRTLLEKDKAERADIYPKLAPLLQRYQQICAQIYLHEGLIHPIRRLPDELLGIIFRECLWGDLGGCVDPGLFPDYCVPVKFLLVCKRWRRVALACPNLWASVTLAFSTSELSRDSYRGRRTNRLDEWIQRSGALPLRLHIKVKQNVRPFAQRHWHVLDGYWNRLSQAVIKLPVSAIPFLSSCEPIRAPQLRWLVVEFRSPDLVDITDDDDIPEINISTFRMAPVDEFRLYLSRNIDAGQWDLPWSTLTALTWPCSTFVEVLDVLRKCPMLKTFRIDIDIIWIEGDIPNDILRHTNLQALHVTTDHDLGPLLERLALPALETLGFSTKEVVCGWKRIFDPEDVRGFLDRSQCKVRHLSLCDPKMTPPEFCQLLGYFGNMESFYLDGLNLRMTDEVFRFLTLVEGGPNAAPLLKQMELCNIKPPLSDELLLGMVGSRWRPPTGCTQLRRVALSIHYTRLRNEFWEQLIQFEEEGLDTSGCREYRCQDPDIAGEETAQAGPPAEP